MSNADLKTDHVRLYQHTMHVVVRVAVGFILVLYAIGLEGIAFRFPDPFTRRDFGAMVVVALFPWFATILLHTRRLQGSARGLEYKSDGRWIAVAWSKVGQPEYAWWTGSNITFFGRVATMHVPGKTKPIWFFANDRILADLRRLRDAGITAETAPKAQ